MNNDFWLGCNWGLCTMVNLKALLSEHILPSSVMMGMLDPVVTDACRTKPCTGLLSGDDLSIPGGVKPLNKPAEKRSIISPF